MICSAIVFVHPTGLLEQVDERRAQSRYLALAPRVVRARERISVEQPYCPFITRSKVATGLGAISAADPDAPLR